MEERSSHSTYSTYQHMKTLPLCEEVTYVLLCEEGVYYVGKTKQLHQRLISHFSGQGSIVTRTYKPIKLVNLSAGNCEKQLVQYGRKRYGKTKCYGGSFHLNSIF